MKKVMLLLSAIILAWFIGCVKEAEQPPIEYKYSVEATNEDFSDKGVNETVSLPFSIKAEYDFEKVPMKYKVETDKQGVIKNGDETILPNDVYTMTSPELNLSYEGKEAGEHTIKVTFFNDNTKKATTTKEIKLKYIEYEYTLEALSAKNSVYQGEAADFEYKLTPKDETKKEGYTITFKSYDDQDIKLERTNITFNGQRIEFNKSYPIENLSSFKIQVIPFYAGAKSLKYEIKNKTGKREGDIAIEVKQNVFEVAGNLDKTPIGATGEIVNFVGTVKKEPLYAKKLKYKTSIIQGTAEGIETNDWKEITYEGNEIKIPVKILKNGQYQYKISFQDEFGNQAEKILPINSQANYRFRVEVEGRNNPLQGETVTYRLKIVREEPILPSDYRLILAKEVEGDDIARRSEISVSGTKVAGKENEYDIKKENEEFITTVTIKSFSIGAKKLKYKIYRHVGGVSGETVEGYIDFNVQKSEFRIEQETLNKDKINNIGDVIVHTAKVIKTNTGGTIKYKISVLEGDNGGIKDNGEWKDVTLEGGYVKIPINILKEGKYSYNITFKDEFGNEIEGNSKDIRTVENFDVRFSFSKDFILEEIPIDIDLHIETSKHNSSVQYFVSFDTPIVTYNNRVYQPNEKIPIEGLNFKASLLYKKNSIYRDLMIERKKIQSITVFNSDGKEISFYSNKSRYPFPEPISPLITNPFNALHYSSFEQKDSFGQIFGGVEEGFVFDFSDMIRFFDSHFNKEEIKVYIYVENSEGKKESLNTDGYSYNDLTSTFIITRDRHKGYRGKELDNIFQFSDNISIEIFYKNQKVFQESNIEIKNRYGFVISNVYDRNFYRCEGNLNNLGLSFLDKVNEGHRDNFSHEFLKGRLNRVGRSHSNRIYYMSNYNL